jgi:predicted Zn-dependent protease
LKRGALVLAALAAAILTLVGAGRALLLTGRLPAPVPNAMAEANVHLQQGRWGEAARQYQAVVTIDPVETNAWFYLGVALARAGDGEGLRKAQAEARRHRPAMAEALARGVAASAHWGTLDPAQRAHIHEEGRR